LPRRPRLPSSLTRIARGLAAVAAALLATAPAASAQKLQFRHLTPDDGLSSSQIQSIVRDSRGFMWFATRKGLNRYDGYRFTTYRHRAGDPTSLAHSRTDALFEDSRKALWVGTTVGLSRYDRERDAFVNFAIVPGDSVLVNAIAEAQGALWLGTSRGLFRFDRATGRATPHRPDLFRGQNVMAVHEDRARHLWVGLHGAGARELDLGTGRVRRWVKDTLGTLGVASLPGQDVRAFHDDGRGSVWVALIDGGLARIDHATGVVRRFQHDPSNPRSLSLDAVHALLPDGDRGLWVGTENGGLDYFDFTTEQFQHNRYDPNDPSGISSNSVWSLHRDVGGALWVGTFAGGVNVTRQNGDAIRRFSSMAGDPASLSFNAVSVIRQDSRGRVWVATDGGGLNRFDRATGKFVRFDMATSGLNSDAVLAVTEDRSGGIWVGTWAGGISRLDTRTGRFTPLTTRNSALVEDDVFALHADAAGRLWIGTETSGLQRLDIATSTFTSYPIATGLGAQIRSIEETADGLLLIGTALRGLALFDPRTGATRWYREGKGGISNNEVQVVRQDERGIIWIGTTHGLDRIDRRTNGIVHFDEADGLPSGGVTSLEIGARGQLWVSGNGQIMRFDPATESAKSYTVTDGLQGSEFNAGASYRAKDGTLYFGGSQGLNVIEPDRLTENDRAPAVVLTGFQHFNRPVAIGATGSPLRTSITSAASLTFAHDEAVFTLEFAALDFAAPEKNQYAYKLEGLDRDWNYVGGTRTASYTNLAPGSYVFRVKASNNDGVWNEEGASLLIEVTPPFWATTWFRSLVALLVLAAILTIVRSAQARHRRLQALNEQLGRAAEHDRESQQYLERNVLDILRAMQKFSGGDYSVALAVQSEDAIGKLRLGFNSVVADRKRAEEELRQSQKMEAVGRLAGGVAHDFNNLLTVIKGNAELALADIESKDAVREELEEIERASERASSLTRQLLAFSRKQILKPQTLSLNDMVDELARMLRRTVGEDIALSIVLDPALSPVCADPGQIEQVVLNLVVNARDAMPRGGSLRIETCNVAPDDAARHAEAEAGVAYVAILVTDDGTGMTPGVKERVFEPFFTTKEQGKGTGLGLSTVYGSVKQSGGFVEVESELGRGTTVAVYLPRVAARAEVHTSVELERPPAGSATVLLVEDEDAVRRLASRVLSRSGYTVITAEHGEAALEVAARHVGAIDLLLTDIVMPGMSGRELAERLLPLHPGMRLLYASGYTEDAIIRHGVSSQETAFLEKPFTPTALLRKVREVLEEQQPLRPKQVA
jgi:signal transduction histidine kinase/ligand-binding sensor domain-containing protein/ActR/RegA family two-component response regulator